MTDASTWTRAQAWAMVGYALAARWLRDRAELLDTAVDGRLPGILTRGCYNHRIGLATANELIWGSYDLYEVLHVLAGLLEPARI